MDFDAAQWEMAQQQMQNCDPEQMKAQARMMKNMDKDNLRRMNPQFANMSDAEIDMAASQMEMMASNPAMLKMAAAQMGGMSHGQARAQMKAKSVRNRAMSEHLLHLSLGYSSPSHCRSSRVSQVMKAKIFQSCFFSVSTKTV